MKDLSESAQVLASAELWRSKYEQPQGWAVRQDGLSSKDTYDALCALGPNATAADVTLLTGDKTLVEKKKCAECGTRSWACVRLGDSASCVRCVYKALGVLTGLVRP